MQPEEIVAEIKRLSTAQRLRLAQDIWDSIAMESGKVPMPVWQKMELEQRYREYKKGDVLLYDWQEVHERLRQTRQ